MSITGDYDAGILADLKPAVARLRIGKYGTEGTGFLIAKDVVLTCRHVVKELQDGEDLVGRFGESSDEVTLTVERRDPKFDVALLRLKSPVAATPLKIADDGRGYTNWMGYGFPAFTEGVGVPLVGGTLDPNTLDRDRHPAVLLMAQMLTGDSVTLGGFSGTPILKGKTVVGMLYRVLGAKGEWGTTHFGLLYALPATLLRTFVDGTLPPTAQDRTTDDESKHPELTRLLLQLRSSTNGVEMSTSIETLRSRNLLTLPIALMAAEKLLDIGDARAVLKLLDGAGEDVRALQMQALAHSVLGNQQRAATILQGLTSSGETDGLSASVLVRRYLETGKLPYLKSAYDVYASGYEKHKDPYPGINAAALALWKNDRATSRKLAAEVLALAEAKLESKRDHWDWATLGEAKLLLGDLEQAEVLYERAVAKRPDAVRAIASMRLHARKNLEMLGHSRDAFDRVLPVGRVACITGHRVDEPGTKSARFPEANVPGVARKLKQTIEEYQIQIGFASAASGGDLLFIEAMQAAQAEITVVLPFPAVDFIGTSVGQRWRSRFEDALKKLPPDRLVTLHEQTPATETGKNEAYARCNEVIQQNAADAARMLSDTALLVAVVVPAGGSIPRGGTQDAIRLWTEKVRGEVIEINPLAP